MYQYTDQIQKQIQLKDIPKRIVSLVPSQTAFLSSLGLDEEVVGITKFCVHPAQWFRTKQRIGGTKNVNIDQVRSLRPDLIIANKEENVQEQVRELETIAPVWTSDINTIEEALTMIENIGCLTGKNSEAAVVINNILEKRALLTKQVARQSASARVVYLIWKDPYLSAGSDTFINAMLHTCGWSNVFADKKRYPEVSITDLQKVNPDLLLLSSEPYPFKQKHIAELQLLLPRTRIRLVDGEMFSWYGSRMSEAFVYFRQMLQETAW
jgi:ABC-type Fe3+-hydroxamate transport system substrate-binding protein